MTAGLEAIGALPPRRGGVMRVCLLAGEIFAWGKYGGFGRATRKIGGELVRRGIEVFAVVPRRHGQGACEQLDGMTVLGFPRSDLRLAARLYRACDADIYHSEEPSIATWQAMRAMPGRKHMVTFRDTRDTRDWLTEVSLPSRGRIATCLTWLYEANPLVGRAVRRAHALCCAAPCVGRKARRVYGLDHDPEHLPTPIDIPETVRKAEAPTVCYVGRMDRRKRPELFLALPSRFPDVRFVAIGLAQDAAWEEDLRRRYGGQANLEFKGFVDQFGPAGFGDVLGASWVLVNTSAREGLPNAFLEAAAHGCAIVSAVDPDGFASRFGARVGDGDFAAALRGVLAGGRWRALGQAGADFVRERYATEVAMRRHVEVYSRLCGGQQVIPSA